MREENSISAVACSKAHIGLEMMLPMVYPEERRYVRLATNHLEWGVEGLHDDNCIGRCRHRGIIDDVFAVVHDNAGPFKRCLEIPTW